MQAASAEMRYRRMRPGFAREVLATKLAEIARSIAALTCSGVQRASAETIGSVVKVLVLVCFPRRGSAAARG